MTAMRPWSVDKAPANFIEPDMGAGRRRASYGEEKFRRLVALKDKNDPKNVFSLNPNIPPSVKPDEVNGLAGGGHTSPAARLRA
jgi:hypothetical protein